MSIRKILKTYIIKTIADSSRQRLSYKSRVCR